jgi:hypothetical protein
MSNTESTPLSAPVYGASLGVAFSRFWRKYATFSGRASRSEYWWWVLIAVIVAVVFSIIGTARPLAGSTGHPPPVEHSQSARATGFT